jgi:4a-hydroxytetrahydrobiopterin dehydratase
MSEAMSHDDVRAALEQMPAWSLENGKLHRELRFGGFAEALAFLVRVGIEAEKRDHHPELTNVYNRVTIDLTTHDAGGITDKDVDLARAIDAIAPA